MDSIHKVVEFECLYDNGRSGVAGDHIQEHYVGTILLIEVNNKEFTQSRNTIAIEVFKVLGDRSKGPKLAYN